MKTPNVSWDSVRHVTFAKTVRDGRRVQFLMRDTGDLNGLLPIVNAMLTDPRGRWVPEALIAGWVAENFDPNAWASVPARAAFSGWEEGRHPAAFVTTSSCSDPHLQIAARALCPRVPMLYVEDNYQQSKKLFDALKAHRLALPDCICCIDSGSLEDFSSGHPELDRRVYTTSQPVFEAVLHELPSARADARQKLMVCVPLVVFMGTPDNGTLIKELGRALAPLRWARKPIFTVRRHPRDQTTDAGYAEIFDAAGLPYLDTVEHDTQTVARAADLVLAVASTELTVAALRGIPSAHVLDARYLPKLPNLKFPLPHTRAGAVEGCRTVEEAAEFTRRCLDPANEDDLARADRMHARLDRFRRTHPKTATVNIIAHLDELV